MSRVIVNDHLWTADEVEYQLSRSRRNLVDVNRALYGPGGEREGLDDSAPEPENVELKLDKDIYEHIIGLDIEGLQRELLKNKIQPKGSQQDLQFKLAQVLQAKRDDSNS